MQLTAHHLSIGYQAKSPVLQDLEFQLPESSLTCIIGDNGAGKSTLLRTITGAIRPIAGDVFMQLTAISDMSAAQKSRTFSVVLTDRISDNLITVRDLVATGRMPYTGFFGSMSANDEIIVSEAISQLKITDIADRRISEISDGQRQRALIAKAIAQQTPIMILDEPTAFLDYKSRIELMRLLKDLAQGGKSILMTTHDLDLVAKFADWIWAIDGGRITEGTIKDCKVFFSPLSPYNHPQNNRDAEYRGYGVDGQNAD